MSYKIIVDSCCDLTPDMMDLGCFTKVPLGLQIGDYKIMDDDTFDQAEFLRRMKAFPEAPKSSCPSPESFLRAYEGPEEEDVYVICITGSLSGTYNCALQGRHIYFEEHPGSNKNIHVFDSKSASPGQVRAALKIRELAESGLPFADVVEKINRFIQESKLYFVLDSVENLRKNGRLSNLAASVVTKLHIKLIMQATQDGVIEKLSQDISMKRALLKMVDMIANTATNCQEKTLVVNHCANRERGQFVLDAILKRCPFKDGYLLEMGGLTTLYANEGGIMVGF